MRVDHVSINVSSLSESMPYYGSLLPILGFSKVKDYIWTDGAGFYLQFRQAQDGLSPYQRYGAGMSHLGFGANSVEDLNIIRERMRAAGYSVPDIQNIDGALALFMKDPDGIRFEIIYYPPGVAVVD